MCPTYGIKLDMTGGSLGSYSGLSRWTSDIYTITSSSKIPRNVVNRLVSILTVKSLHQIGMSILEYIIVCLLPSIHRNH